MNTSRLPTDVIKLGLQTPTLCWRASWKSWDTNQGSEAEDSIELMNAEGVFLQIEVPAEEDPAEEDGREGEVSELKIRLAKANTKANTRVKELWGQQCAEFDEH